MISELKKYLRYKTGICHKVAFDVQLMNFFIWRKNNILFSRYLDFCVFVKSADFDFCDVIISIAAFHLNPKYYQDEIWSNNSVVYDKHF